jgi:hypothetical protein
MPNDNVIYISQYVFRGPRKSHADAHARKERCAESLRKMREHNVRLLADAAAQDKKLGNVRTIAQLQKELRENENPYTQ